MPPYHPIQHFGTNRRNRTRTVFRPRPAGELKSPQTSFASRAELWSSLLAESIIGLCKTDLIRLRGPRRGLEAVEFATLKWVHWFNHRRLPGTGHCLWRLTTRGIGKILSDGGAEQHDPGS